MAETPGRSVRVGRMRLCDHFAAQFIPNCGAAQCAKKTRDVLVASEACSPWQPRRDATCGLLAPGSYLILSHLTSDFAPERMRNLHDEAKRHGGETIQGRPKEAIQRSAMRY
jgi:hypothetical protein